jgi:hypothetical protein
MSPTCATCASALTPLGSAREAEHGTVRGSLDAAPAYRCPDGHGVVAADVAAARTEVRDLLPVAERTRIRNTLRCATCRTPFRMPGRRATRSLTLTTTGLPATQVTLDIPVLRCTEDAIQSLPPECLDDLDAVLGVLLEPPS